MGSCQYYMKVTFPRPLTEEQAGQINAFLAQSGKAYEFWQAHRGGTNRAFWAALKKAFPMTHEYLDALGKTGKDHNNELCGLLWWGTEGDHEDYAPAAGDTSFRFSCEESHLADWTERGEYFKKKYGACAFNWLSEESDGCGLADILDLQEEAGIVEAILGKPNAELPGFLGIHPLLDARIAERLAK